MGIRSIKPLYPFAYTGAPNRNRTSDTQFRKLHNYQAFMLVLSFCFSCGCQTNFILSLGGSFLFSKNFLPTPSLTGGLVRPIRRTKISDGENTISPSLIYKDCTLSAIAVPVGVTARPPSLVSRNAAGIARPILFIASITSSGGIWLSIFINAISDAVIAWTA